MNKIKLNYKDAIFMDGHTSRGNQPKWFVDGQWYKKDQWGYEGLAETMVSNILVSSGINSVIYKPSMIEIEDKGIFPGCVSKNFIPEGKELIPIHRLHRKITGQGLMQTIFMHDSVEESIKYTVDFVQRVTGLNNFGEYLTKMLEFDAFFLNEDRHTNNIALLMDTDSKEFLLCPYFDCGLSLLSDTNLFPFDKDLMKCIGDVQSRPFSSFEKQVDAARKLYGQQLSLNINREEIEKLLNELSEYYPESYINRVSQVLDIQMEKYPEMIQKNKVIEEIEER